MDEAQLKWHEDHAGMQHKDHQEDRKNTLALVDEIRRLRREIERLREALAELEPSYMLEFYEDENDDYKVEVLIPLGKLRKADRVLRPEESEEKKDD